MKNPVQSLLALTALAALPLSVAAQPSAHYPPGVEGIKGSSLPPPGVYFRDYNWFYYSDQLNNSSGNENKGADADAFVYATIPRVLWITDLKLLGGYIGFDALVPFKNTSLKFNNPPPQGGRFDDSTFGVGDMFVETTWSWHPKQFDLAVAYGVWAPTGDYSPNNPTWAGAGFWTHMMTAAVTWYPDQEKKWAASALSRYEISQEQEDTGVTPGQVYTVEWGLSYALKPTIDVGLAGYYQGQTTKDNGSRGRPDKDMVVGLGPEITAVCPKIGVLFSLRYLYEVAAESRLQGQTICFTLTKQL